LIWGRKICCRLNGVEFFGLLIWGRKICCRLNEVMFYLKSLTPNKNTPPRGFLSILDFILNFQFKISLDRKAERVSSTPEVFENPK